MPTTRIEKPQRGISGVPFMNSRTRLSAIARSTCCVSCGSAIGTEDSGASAGRGGADRQRVDRAVVEALADGIADQTVLVDPRQALELGRADDRPQMVAAALVDDLDPGTG